MQWHKWRPGCCEEFPPGYQGGVCLFLAGKKFDPAANELCIGLFILKGFRHSVTLELWPVFKFKEDRIKISLCPTAKDNCCTLFKWCPGALHDANTVVINSFKELEVCICLCLRDYIPSGKNLEILFVRIPSRVTGVGETLRCNSLLIGAAAVSQEPQTAASSSPGQVFITAAAGAAPHRLRVIM